MTEQQSAQDDPSKHSSEATGGLSQDSALALPAPLPPLPVPLPEVSPTMRLPETSAPPPALLKVPFFNEACAVGLNESRTPLSHGFPLPSFIVSTELPPYDLLWCKISLCYNADFPKV